MKSKIGQFRTTLPECDYRAPIQVQSRKVQIYQSVKQVQSKCSLVKQLSYKDISYFDLLNTLKSQKLNIIETVFFSNQGKPIAICSNQKNGILIKIITSALDVSQIVKNFLLRTFTLPEISNASLIELLSNPKTSTHQICFANYGTFNQEVAILTTNELCKSFMTTSTGLNLESLQIFPANTKLYQYTFVHMVTYDASSRNQTSNELHHVPFETCIEEIKSTQATQINLQLKKLSEKLIAKLDLKIVSINLVYMVELKTLKPWLLRIDECSTVQVVGKIATAKITVKKDLSPQFSDDKPSFIGEMPYSSLEEAAPQLEQFDLQSPSQVSQMLKDVVYHGLQNNHYKEPQVKVRPRSVKQPEANLYASLAIIGSQYGGAVRQKQFFQSNTTRKLNSACTTRPKSQKPEKRLIKLNYLDFIKAQKLQKPKQPTSTVFNHKMSGWEELSLDSQAEYVEPPSARQSDPELYKREIHEKLQIEAQKNLIWYRNGALQHAYFEAKRLEKGMPSVISEINKVAFKSDIAVYNQKQQKPQKLFQKRSGTELGSIRHPLEDYPEHQMNSVRQKPVFRKKKVHQHAPVSIQPNIPLKKRPQSSLQIQISKSRSTSQFQVQTIQSFKPQCDMKLFCKNDQVKLRESMLATDQCYIDSYNAVEAVRRIQQQLLDDQSLLQLYNSQHHQVPVTVQHHSEQVMNISSGGGGDFGNDILQPCCARCFCVLTFMLTK